MAHQCTKCDLLFSTRSEVETHMAEDHAEPVEATVGDEPEAPEPESAESSAGEPRRGLLGRLFGSK